MDFAQLAIALGIVIAAMYVIKYACDSFEDASDFLVLTRPRVPPMLLEPLVRITDVTVEAYAMLEEAWKAYRQDPTRVTDATHQVSDLEQKIDGFLWDATRAVFSSDLELAEKLFVGPNPLMQIIEMRGFESAQMFQVVGVLQERTDSVKRTQTKDATGRTTSANVYIPLSTFKALYTTKNIDRSPGMLKVERVELSEIRVEFDSVEQVISSLPRLRDALDTTRQGVVDYEIQVPIAILNTIKAQKARDTRMLMYIACISLLVGGIGIMNIMLATVTERTQEIGVRRALGATRGDITVQFLTETLMLCLIGGSIGVLGGCGFAAFRHHILETTTLVTEWSVLLAFGLSVMVGIIFGMYPARRAANLDPIEALRHT